MVFDCGRGQVAEFEWAVCAIYVVVQIRKAGKPEGSAERFNRGCASSRDLGIEECFDGFHEANAEFKVQVSHAKSTVKDAAVNALNREVS